MSDAREFIRSECKELFKRVEDVVIYGIPVENSLFAKIVAIYNLVKEEGLNDESS